MAQFKKHFSLDEARAMLPDLRTRFAEIRQLAAQIRAVQEQSEQDRLRILSGNGKGPIVLGASPLIEKIQQHIDYIVQHGVQIKDLERGLIDFPHFLNGDGGNEVFLCYEMAEPDIAYWHEIDSGFDGRRPL